MTDKMDVTGSLRKIAKELLALEREDPDLESRLEAASWLIEYIANALDVELQHAAARGRFLSRRVLEEGNVMPSSFPLEIMSGEDI